MTATRCKLCKARRDIRAIEGVALCVDKRACLRRVSTRIHANFRARHNTVEADNG